MRTLNVFIVIGFAGTLLVGAGCRGGVPVEPIESVTTGLVTETIRDIEVISPKRHAAVQSPIVIEGRARGLWFFEADAPVQLHDSDGNLIAEHYITAQGEWMTDDLVPFAGELAFTPPSGVTDIVLTIRGAHITDESGSDYERIVTIPLSIETLDQ